MEPSLTLDKVVKWTFIFELTNMLGTHGKRAEPGGPALVVSAMRPAI